MCANAASTSATMNVFIRRIVSVGQCRVKSEFLPKPMFGALASGTARCFNGSDVLVSC
jgi:hypothetical protein